ncbi:PfkB family carbohydrate kinase [Microbacterium sp. 179-I 3D4 NHS]|uniref:PfkB family carbohydrate kinase n=1 Tax=Microbacterium sp. 179-I 3D4 NHS TaxID=3142381 RepID=UPI0039A09962
MTTRSEDTSTLDEIPGTRPPFDVAVIGDNTIDRFVDEPALGDLVGGNALNVAVQLSMMGLRVRYYGSVGDDADAEIIRQAIALRGLDLAGVRTERGSTALTCIRRRDDGDRYFESESFGVTAHYAPDEREIAEIAAARWVHVGMLPDAATVRDRLRAVNPGVVLSQDCSVTPGYDDLTVAFMSAGEDEQEAASVTAAALAAGVTTAVATLGSLGALGRDAHGATRVEGRKVDVVDTTGAGDSFMAGYIAAVLEGAALAEALEAGTRRGGFTCQYVGGWPQLAGDVEVFG